MPKTRTGDKISWKVFFKRWKEGINGVDIYQKINIQIFSTRIILFGILSGFIISLLQYKLLWWLSLILLGSLINTYISYSILKNQKNTIDKLKEMEVNNGF